MCSIQSEHIKHCLNEHNCSLVVIHILFHLFGSQSLLLFNLSNQHMLTNPHKPWMLCWLSGNQFLYLNQYLIDSFLGKVVWEQSFGISSMLFNWIDDQHPICIRPPCSNYPQEKCFLGCQTIWFWTWNFTHLLIWSALSGKSLPAGSVNRNSLLGKCGRSQWPLHEQECVPL